MKKWYRELKTVARDLGGQEVEVKSINGHLTLTGKFGDKPFKLRTSGSPSSPVAINNIERDLIRARDGRWGMAGGS